MRPGAKLAAFALVLAAAFGGGAALGAVFEPDQPAPTMQDHDMGDMGGMTEQEHQDMINGR